MVFSDFVVRYDPDKESKEDLTKKILYAIFIKKRIRANKPCIIFIGGDSGEGKSFGALSITDVLLGLQGIDFLTHVNDVNVYTPLEYAPKLNKLLFSKDLKKVNVFVLQEARELIKAKLWYTFLNQAVSDINAMSRSVKRIITIIVSQFIRDISPDIRYTLNYYITARRPAGKLARLYIKVLWKDDRDLEKPKLRKRRLTGYLIYPNGRYVRYVPRYMELRLPRKEIVDIFEKNDMEAKTYIIKKKINKLMKEIEKDIGIENPKVEAMIKYYSEHFESLNMIGKFKRNKYRLTNDFKKMHELTDTEAAQFESKLNEELKKKGIIELPGIEQ